MKRRRVAIVGVGVTAFRSVSPDVSYRELTHEAAVKAYLDAGVEPKDIDGFVCASEDMLEGYSISDEYAPDQLGAVLKPVQTVPGDGIQAMATAYMMVLTGQFDIMAVQGLSKASNMLTIPNMVNFGMDPVLNRPLNGVYHYVAGLEMQRFMYETGATRDQIARVVVKNRRNALNNPVAGYGCNLSIKSVIDSGDVCSPLKKLDIAQHADGAVVLVMCAEHVVDSLDGEPLWIEGIGWVSDSPTFESRDWSSAVSTRMAAEMALKQAGMSISDIDFAEVNDEYAFKELQHIEALGLCGRGGAGQLVDAGETGQYGAIPVNVSGGALGVGHLFECSGLHKVSEVCTQLRGHAGARQIKDVEVGLAHAWRGVPSTTSAVAILTN